MSLKRLLDQNSKIWLNAKCNNLKCSNVESNNLTIEKAVVDELDINTLKVVNVAKLDNIQQDSILELDSDKNIIGSSLLSLSKGGLNASLTANNGGIFYSTGSAGAILGGTATSGQILRSGLSSAPSWSTATYPNTISANNLLYGSSGNVVSGLSTANNGSLVTDGSGVPSISSTLPISVQSNITRLGTIANNLTVNNPSTNSRIYVRNSQSNGSSSVNIMRNDINGRSELYLGTDNAVEWLFAIWTGTNDVVFRNQTVNYEHLRFKAGSGGADSESVFAGSVYCGNDLTVNAGDCIVNTAGNTLKIKQGTNACAGIGATLVAGTVTVNTTAVSSNDIIILSRSAVGGTPGFTSYTISDGVSFTINSSSGTDTSTFSWVIVKAA